MNRSAETATSSRATIVSSSPGVRWLRESVASVKVRQYVRPTARGVRTPEPSVCTHDRAPGAPRQADRHALRARRAELRQLRGRRHGETDVRRAHRAALRDQRPERRQQLRRARLLHRHRATQHAAFRPRGHALHRRLRGLDVRRRHLSLQRGALGAAVEAMADDAVDHQLPRASDLLPSERSAHRQRRDRQPRPAHRRGRARLHDDDDIVRAAAAERRC